MASHQLALHEQWFKTRAFGLQSDVRYRLEDQEPIPNLTPSTPTSPPDVKYRLEDQEPILNLTPSTPASPPDVRYRLEDQ